MAIKESSDELNPTVTTAGGGVTSPRAARSAKDYLALAIATCGVGYLPLAPGTWGSLVGIGLYLLIRGVLMKTLLSVTVKSNTVYLFYAVVAFEVVFVSSLSLLGVWAASRTEQLSGKKDPSKVVIDEVAGQFIALIPVPFIIKTGWWWFILAFILFRFFDIVKPYPARTFESLKGGLGIMADDIVAGIYAAMAVALAITIMDIV
jgi:phosphatidylglycerophosphatase A